MACWRRTGLAGPKAQDLSITTDRVHEMWGTGKTDGFTLRKGRDSIFLALDHRNSECGGLQAAKVGNSFYPPGRQGALRPVCSGRGRGSKAAVTIMAASTCPNDFQRKIRFLDIFSSPAFVPETEGNG